MDAACVCGREGWMPPVRRPRAAPCKRPPHLRRSTPGPPRGRSSDRGDVADATTLSATEADELARAAAAGSDRAFQRLVTAVHPRLFRWALAYTGSADDAEDIAQEALIRAHRALPRFQFDAAVTTWLWRIVRHAAADWRRGNRRRRAREDHALGSMPVAAPPTDPPVDARRGAERVAGWLAELPARQREAFTLLELEGLDTAAAAARTGLAEATMRVHLLRARRALRRRIIEEDPALAEDIREL